MGNSNVKDAAQFIKPLAEYSKEIAVRKSGGVDFVHNYTLISLVKSLKDYTDTTSYISHGLLSVRYQQDEENFKSSLCGYCGGKRNADAYLAAYNSGDANGFYRLFRNKYHNVVFSDMNSVCDEFKFFSEDNYSDDLIETLNSPFPSAPSEQVSYALLTLSFSQKLEQIRDRTENLILIKKGEKTRNNGEYPPCAANATKIGIKNLKSEALDITKSYLREEKKAEYGFKELPPLCDVNKNFKKQTALKIFFATLFSGAGIALTIGLLAVLIVVVKIPLDFLPTLIFLAGGGASLYFGITKGEDLAWSIVEKERDKKYKQINDPIEREREKTEKENGQKFAKYFEEYADKLSYDLFDYLFEKCEEIKAALTNAIYYLNERIQGFDVLPAKYRTDSYALQVMREYFSDKRVETIKEAVNLYVQEGVEQKRHEELKAIETERLKQAKRQADYEEQRAEYAAAQAKEAMEQSETLGLMLKELKRSASEQEKYERERNEKISQIREDISRGNEQLRETKNELWRANNEREKIRQILESDD